MLRFISYFCFGFLGSDVEFKVDFVFLYVKVGMMVIVDDGKDWCIDLGSW